MFMRLGRDNSGKCTASVLGVVDVKWGESGSGRRFWRGVVSRHGRKSGKSVSIIGVYVGGVHKMKCQHEPKLSEFRFAVCRKGHVAIYQRTCRICGKNYCITCYGDTLTAALERAREEARRDERE